MKFGLMFANSGPFSVPETFDALIRTADEVGFESLWTMEHVVVPGVVESLRVITKAACDRIVKCAFELARTGGRRRVTFCHKADVLRLSDGLFLACARQVAGEYPFIGFEEAPIDNVCMGLALHPEKYDVLVMENLFGDVLSDLCAGLVGGLGVVPGANCGELGAVFEPIHGSAPKYAGQNKVNPTAAMLSAVMMLRHLGERDAADRLERAIAGVIAEGKRVTYDMKPRPNDPTAVGTSQFADAVIEALAHASCQASRPSRAAPSLRAREVRGRG